MKAIRTKAPQREYDALKPVFGSRGQPPFYDPNDLHVHVWHKGKLGNEDNPKSPIYNKAKLNIRDCVYCKICHKIKENFQSTVGENRDVVENMLEPVVKQKESEDYQCIVPKPNVEDLPSLEEVPLTPSPTPSNKELNQRLFLNPEGVFDDYVKVLKEPKESEVTNDE